MHASPLAAIERLTTRDERLVCGLMSGTSVDGVDAALVRIRGCGPSTRVHVEAFAATLFPEDVQQMIFAAMDVATSTIHDICLLDAALARVYAHAVRQLCREAGIDTAELDLIGMHGQTLYHAPEPLPVGGWEVGGTFQAGSGAALAALLGVPVVSDFRAADVALGGQGAPLAPYVDWLLCRSGEEDRILLNIGGIANLTLLPAGGDDEDVTAWDAGPGNMVIDALMRRLYGREFDRDGAVAASGTVIDDLLEWCMRHPYFQKPPPKSSGREQFGAAFVEEFLSIASELASRVPADLVATATACTVEGIARALRTLEVPHGSALYVSGGGAHNCTLMDGLRAALPGIRFGRLSELGLDADSKEAVYFAVLANEWLFGYPANLPAVTGASRRTVCGSFSM